jgi:ParB/RepB/Spo0J family partition protein
MTLHLEYLNTTTIQPYKKNPRIHQRKQIAQIAHSIQTFAFNNPILIDEKNEIIAGHGRWLAAQELQLSEVPVIKLLHLNEAQKKAYRIADNKLTENGQWDVDSNSWI